MKKRCLQTAANIVIAAIAVVLMLRQAESSVMAQGGRPRPGTPARERQLLDRELALRNLERERYRTPTDQRIRLPYEQINEDFKRIQIINNEIMRAAHGSSVLDYKSVSERTGEIKRRASRLKSNLVLPATDKDEKRQKSQDAAGAVQLKSALAALDKLIAGFVTSPIFKSAGVIDQKLSSQARRDLEDIIELSDKIKKDAERLHKGSDEQH